MSWLMCIAIYNEAKLPLPFCTLNINHLSSVQFWDIHLMYNNIFLIFIFLFVLLHVKHILPRFTTIYHVQIYFFRSLCRCNFNRWVDNCWLTRKIVTLWCIPATNLNNPQEVVHCDTYECTVFIQISLYVTASSVRLFLQYRLQSCHHRT